MNPKLNSAEFSWNVVYLAIKMEDILYGNLDSLTDNEFLDLFSMICNGQEL